MNEIFNIKKAPIIKQITSHQTRELFILSVLLLCLVKLRIILIAQNGKIEFGYIANGL